MYIFKFKCLKYHEKCHKKIRNNEMCTIQIHLLLYAVLKSNYIHYYTGKMRVFQKDGLVRWQMTSNKERTQKKYI